MKTAAPVGREARIRAAATLWFLLFIFVLRVAGQLFVSLGWAPWLPPMEEWYSGLIPYGPLLAAQILIVAFCSKVGVDLTRGSGYFAVAKPWLGRGLRAFGSAYLAAMVFRYVVRLSLLPEARWTGGAIPIFFHWVLAAWVLTLARYHGSGMEHAPGAPLAKTCRQAPS